MDSSPATHRPGRARLRSSYREETEHWLCRSSSATVSSPAPQHPSLRPRPGDRYVHSPASPEISAEMGWRPLDLGDAGVPARSIAGLEAVAEEMSPAPVLEHVLPISERESGVRDATAGPVDSDGDVDGGVSERYHEGVAVLCLKTLGRPDCVVVESIAQIHPYPGADSVSVADDSRQGQSRCSRRRRGLAVLA